MQTTRPSLRSHFAWTFAGNAVHGAGQWAILSVIAKLGSTEMLGEYALAVAIATPFAMLSHLNLRAVLATDVAGRHPFSDYYAVRLWASAVGLAAVAAVAYLTAANAEAVAVTIVVGLSLIVESISDLYYGWMQRRERMDLVGRSMIVRTLLSIAAAIIALWVTRSILAAVLAVAAGRMLVLLFHDVRVSRATRGSTLDPREVLRAAVPLGVVLMLSSLTANVPRYAIERTLGTRELGVFAAVASFIAIGSTMMNALGQSATTRLASYFERGERQAFRRLSWQLAGIAVAVGMAGVLTSYVAGELVLRLIYRPEFGAYKQLLIEVMLAGTFSYVAIALGYVITSTRTFIAQMPLLTAVVVSCGAASFLAVPWIGLSGAALAIAVAGCMQIAGQLYILRRAL